MWQWYSVGIAVTEVVSGFTVSANLNRAILHMTKESRDLGYVEELDRRITQRDQLGLT